MQRHYKLMQFLSTADDYLQFVLGFLLLLLALVLILQTMIAIPHIFAGNSADMLVVIHDVMLVMIVLELLWTVLTYLREHSVPLEPFLFVGIISSVRKFVLIGAQMSLGVEAYEAMTMQLQEILLHGVLVLVLVISLVLVRWSKQWKSKEDLRVVK